MEQRLKFFQTRQLSQLMAEACHEVCPLFFFLIPSLFIVSYVSTHDSYALFALILQAPWTPSLSNSLLFLIGAMPYAVHDGHGFKLICVQLVSITTSKEGVTPIF